MFSKILAQLKKLKLPPAQFAIFGSGPMAARGIRESKDLDIVVKPALWKTLIKQHPTVPEKPDCIRIGDLEIFNGWKPWFEITDELVDTADLIDGVRYVKLDYVIRWKQAMGREKDLNDIKLIEQYLSTQSL